MVGIDACIEDSDGYSAAIETGSVGTNGANTPGHSCIRGGNILRFGGFNEPQRHGGRHGQGLRIAPGVGAIGRGQFHFFYFNLLDGLSEA
jgi:hypothetical protein